MLAEIPHTPAGSGFLSRDVHPTATFLCELVNFIKDELPQWRDRTDRKKVTSETSLTSQLCAHLNSAARRSKGWDILQFRTEETDTKNGSRKIDLAPAPCNTNIWIDGRCHADFDHLMPIECKRMPTPKGRDRDEREYVISQYSSTGGIQRFKAGHHGSNHRIGAMIGYVQDKSGAFWSKKVKEWIEELIKAKQKGWSAKDFLQPEDDDAALKLYTLRSYHEREGSLPEIELCHLWIEMTKKVKQCKQF